MQQIKQQLHMFALKGTQRCNNNQPVVSHVTRDKKTFECKGNQLAKTPTTHYTFIYGR